MFQDERAIHVVSGKGGDGIVAFRREKFAPRGGPAGGNGGRGGSVLLRASPQLTTFFDMEDRVEYRAPAGKPGEGSFEELPRCLDMPKNHREAGKRLWPR